jgi:hypothetical protein
MKSGCSRCKSFAINQSGRMREEGLEPSRLAAQEPKSCVSAIPPLSQVPLKPAPSVDFPPIPRFPFHLSSTLSAWERCRASSLFPSVNHVHHVIADFDFIKFLVMPPHRLRVTSERDCGFCVRDACLSCPAHGRSTIVVQLEPRNVRMFLPELTEAVLEPSHEASGVVRERHTLGLMLSPFLQENVPLFVGEPLKDEVWPRDFPQFRIECGREFRPSRLSPLGRHRIERDSPIGKVPRWRLSPNP